MIITLYQYWLTGCLVSAFYLLVHVQCPDKPLVCVRRPLPLVSLSPPGSRDTVGPSTSQQGLPSKPVQRPPTSPYRVFSKTAGTVCTFKFVLVSWRYLLPIPGNLGPCPMATQALVRHTCTYTLSQCSHMKVYLTL